MDPQNPNNSFTILIAEDDHALGLLVERTLQRSGFRTHRVHNGREALEYCNIHSPERTFLLLDYELGDMTAEEVILEMEAWGRKFPFIVMTGRGSEKTAVKMMKLGSEDYIVKSQDALELLVPVLSQALERIQIKQALDSAQCMLHKTHHAIMAAANGVMISDLSVPDYPIVNYNSAFEEISGYRCGPNPTLHQWLDSYEANQPGLQDIRQAIQDRRSVQVHLKGSAKPVQHHEISLSFIHESSRQENVCIGILTDNTQKYLSDQHIRQLRQQLEQTQRLAITGQIAKELAHEIGQPLTLISSKIQFMANGNEPDNQDLLSILKHIDRITHLLIRFSRNEGAILSPSYISVPSAIQSIVDLCPFSEKVSIRVDVPDNLPKIFVDKAKIIQILLNLTVNAIEACGQTGGEVLISSRIVSDSETQTDYIAISVTDSGPGMDGEILDKIFEPFYSTKSSSHDRGLGLPICQMIASQHHGRIEVHSHPGQGACFTLMLPLEPVAGEQHREQTDHQFNC